MSVDCAGVADIVVSPDVFEQEVTVLNPAEPLGKVEQQFVFGCG